MEVKRFPRASAGRAEDTPRATGSSLPAAEDPAAFPGYGRRNRADSNRGRRFIRAAQAGMQSPSTAFGQGGPMAEIAILQGDDQSHHSTQYCIGEEVIRRLGLG